jgi:hypothetical protein
VLTEALDTAPGLRNATVVETRVGFRPTSGDGLPLLGCLTLDVSRFDPQRPRTKPLGERHRPTS